MNENIIEKIRDNVDILEVIKEYVPTVKKSGSSYKACCPFHQEKTPSFSISPDKGLFYCFGCQTGGDVFAFLMKMENLSFNEAARRLAKRAGIEWQAEETMTEEERSRLVLYKLLDFARIFYVKQLFSERGDSARKYVKSRNLTKETVEKFSLGLSFFDGISVAAQKAGFSIQDLRRTGLISLSNGSDLFKNRLMFPILNHRGETVAFGGRIMGEGQPKYLNSPDTPLFSKSRILYALNFAGPSIRKEGRAVLLEGYMDVIAAHQAGVENCVAPLGTSFNEGHAKLLKRYTDNVTVLFDPDSAGQKASIRTALILIENGFYVTVAVLTEGLDPDEYITKYGTENFKKVITSGKDIINYQLDKVLNGVGEINAKQKSEIAQNLIEIIKRQQDKIIRNEWAKLVANRLGIAPDILLENLKKGTIPTKESQVKQPLISQKGSNFPPSELALIKILLKYPDYITLCDNFDKGVLSNSETGVILNQMALLQREGGADVGFGFVQKLIDKLPELKDFILQISVEEPLQGLKPRVEIASCLANIEKQYLQRRFKQLQQKISAYKAGQVPLDLLKEQIEIQKKLKTNN